MAIGFNLPGIPSQIKGTAEEAGAVPDLGQAMMQGFRSNIENVQGYPRQLAQQLLSNQLANKIRGAEAQYAQPMAETNYQRALMELKYLPQEKQSALAQTGLQQQLLQRQIEAQNLDTRMRQQFANLMGSPAQQPSTMQPTQAPAPTIQAQPGATSEFKGMPFRLPEQKPEELPAPNLGETVKQGIAQPNAKTIIAGDPNQYKLDAIYDANPMMHKYFKDFGLTKDVKVVTNPKTNETMIQTKYPSGKVTAEIVQVGKTPGEAKFEEETAKSRAKYLDEAAPVLSDLSSTQENLDSIASILNNKAESINAIGKMNKPFAELFGNQEQQDILGQLQFATGNILMEAAKNIKGAFTGRDMGFVNSMKPNVNEPYYVMVAKTGAMQAFNQMAYRRLELASQLVENGMSPRQAVIEAARRTPLEPIKKQYEDQLKQAKLRTTNSINLSPEKRKYAESLSDEQILAGIK